MAKDIRILLFYHFTDIENPEKFTEDHLAYCKSIGVKGRILIAKNGINGTLSGDFDQTEAYMEHMKNDPRFKDIWFKIDEVEEDAFKKIFVRHKEELVTFRVDTPDPREITGKHLTPKEFYEALQEDDVLVIDGRNDYEYDLGHFRGAIRPEISSFREFPQWIEENLADKKDKKVIMYCTGGVRCEILSGYFMQEGFEDVGQLHGGIVSYGKDPEVQGRLFDGRCYVFDERISVPINRTEEDILISHCIHCGVPTERYINCANPLCNKQHFCCTECEPEHKASCSVECQEHPKNRFVLHAK